MTLKNGAAGKFEKIDVEGKLIFGKSFNNITDLVM